MAKATDDGWDDDGWGDDEVPSSAPLRDVTHEPMLSSPAATRVSPPVLPSTPLSKKASAIRG